MRPLSGATNVTDAFRTATSSHKLVDEDTTQHLSLMHSVVPYRTEWRSLCGYGFLSYETQWEPRVVTCVWCIAGVARRIRFDF